MVQPIPDGQRTLSPHLTYEDANKAIEWYTKVFGAEEVRRSVAPDGKILHAEIQIGDSRLYLNDSFTRSTPTPGTAVTINLWTDDVDAVYLRAVQAGASKVFPWENQVWGDRYGKVKDPFGYIWGISQHVEDLSPDEIAERGKAFFSSLETNVG